MYGKTTMLSQCYLIKIWVELVQYGQEEGLN